VLKNYGTKKKGGRARKTTIFKQNISIMSISILKEINGIHSINHVNI